MRRVHRALAAGSDLFVIAGGWASRLLRAHPCASKVMFAPIVTNDLDIAATDKPPRKGNEVGAALAAEGFVADLRTDDRPPVTSYQLGDFELEFIAPSLPRRHRAETVDVLGVSAQKARDVEILLVEPVRIAFPELSAELTVTNPASFMMQRLLIIPARRSMLKKGKDALYLHDALILFGPGGHLHPDVLAQAARVQLTLTADQKARGRTVGTELAKPDNAVIREAARQAEATGRTGATSPEAIALVIRTGLAELWPG